MDRVVGNEKAAASTRQRRPLPQRDTPRLVSGHGHVTASWRVQSCLWTPNWHPRLDRSGAAV